MTDRVAYSVHHGRMHVIDRLLDSDPAIGWPVTDAPPDEVAAERARLTHEGWGARPLPLQGGGSTQASTAASA